MLSNGCDAAIVLLPGGAGVQGTIAKHKAEASFMITMPKNLLGLDE